MSCSEFVFISNSPNARSQDTFEDAWEGQEIVDLIGIITSSCCNDSGSSQFGFFWSDFWIRIRKSKDDRLIIHGLDVLSSEDIRLAHSDKNIRTGNDGAQVSSFLVFVEIRNSGLICIHIRSSLDDGSLAIQGHDMGCTSLSQ
jgi:hypothetical protein